MPLLPDGRNAFLPISPTDGQVYIDADRVKWVFNANSDFWERTGVVDDLPIADALTIGIMTAQDKEALDRVPAVGGGFGIITPNAKLLLQSPSNPEGVIKGDIELKSESLDIICVGPDRVRLNCSTPPLIDCTTPDHVPALAFKLSDKFIDTFIVNRPGPRGDKGLRGSKGAKGDPGFDPSGPKGIKGKAGGNITDLCELVGVTYNDLEGLTDTAIVDLRIIDEGHGCHLVATKSKLNIDTGAPADAVIATALSRSIVYGDEDPSVCQVARLQQWQLVQPAEDTTPANLQLVRLSKGSNDAAGAPIDFDLTMSLAEFVGAIADEYHNKLVKADKQWGLQVKGYIEGIDNKARGILSDLANDLAQCEFNLPATDYCITLRSCDAPGSPTASAAAAAGMFDPHQMSAKGRDMATVQQGLKSWKVRA